MSWNHLRFGFCNTLSHPLRLLLLLLGLNAVQSLVGCARENKIEPSERSKAEVGVSVAYYLVSSKVMDNNTQEQTVDELRKDFPTYKQAYNESLRTGQPISIYNGLDLIEAKKLQLQAANRKILFAWPRSDFHLFKTQVYKSPTQNKTSSK